jgi:molybdopterin/thiamine biosynthesis adenylyltransferase
VSLSNLHRQIIHSQKHLDCPKVQSAQQRLAEFNPDVKVETLPYRFDADNGRGILSEGWDAIVDGGDNFPLRYLLNDLAAERRITVCHGSVDRFEGRVTTFIANTGPCYRCLFPRPPAEGLIASCVERGVLGMLPGIIGTLQATEVIKVILGIGRPLSGRLLTYDALSMEFRTLRYDRDPACEVCSSRC